MRCKRAAKRLCCYRQRQEFLPPFETPQCYLIVGKAPPGPGFPCPRGVLFPSFGKHNWAWDTWKWLWGDPGTSSYVGKLPAPPGALPGVGQCLIGMWHSQEGGSRPSSALLVLLAATAELPSPLRASTALDKASQEHKGAPVSHLRVPRGHGTSQLSPGAAGLQPQIPSPQHRNTSVSAVETADAEWSHV